MKKPYTLLCFVLIIALSLIPPIDFFLTSPENDKWFWMVLASGFACFYLSFLKVDLFVRCLAIAMWFDCFMSSSPYVAFTRYVTIIGCCYFYFVCTKVEDWSIIFKALQALLFLTVSLMIMQTCGHDTLLNLTHEKFVHFGILGQHMQEASFGVVLCAMLILFHPVYFIPAFALSIFCHSTWSFLCAALGAAIYFYPVNQKMVMVLFSLCVIGFMVVASFQKKFDENIGPSSGRVWVWQKTIEIANKKPWTGWGPGMYKVLFPVMSRDKYTRVPYKTAHDFIAQLLFETGYPITLFIISGLALLTWYLVYMKHISSLAGLAMIISDALVHFPERQLQDILIIIAFIAYVRFRRYVYVRNN